MCSSEDSVAVTSMSKELKQGFVMRHKKRLFGSNWRDGILTLHEDSTGRRSNWILLRKLKYFLCCLRDVLPKIERDLSNRI